jgi:methylase of polypeptide subunit release factors
MQKQILIAKLFDLEPLDVALGNYELDENQKIKLKESLELLEKSVPIDYILGEVNILGLKLKVTPKTLIPREETEFWLQEFEKMLISHNEILNISKYPLEISRLKAQREGNIVTNLGSKDFNSHYSETNTNPTSSKTLVDLGSGTGLIGLYLSRFYEKVLMLDIDRETILVADQNIVLNKVKNCKTVLSNGLKNLDLENINSWDLVANLPYVPLSDLPQAVQFNVEHEPQIAIYSGIDGLELYSQVLEQLNKTKNKPQTVLFELDPRNIREAKIELEKLDYKSEIWLDQNNLERVLFGAL